MNKLQNRDKERSNTEINESCCLYELEELILLRCLLPLPSPEDTAWSWQQPSNKCIAISKWILKTPRSSQQSLVWLAIVTFFWRQKWGWSSQRSSLTHSTASSDTKVNTNGAVIIRTITLRTGFHLEDSPSQTEQPQASYEKNIKLILRRRFYKIPDQSSSNLPRISKPRKQN